MTTVAALVAGLSVCIASASAARPLETGLLDFDFTSGQSGLRDALFDDARAASAGIVRFHVGWRSVAPEQPTNAADPADPAYNFAAVDAAVRAAAARDLDVLLTVTSAPAWAEGANRPATAPAGTWRPDAAAYGLFARALAIRYSGAFAPGGGAVLPRVAYFQAWNEPNLSNHLSPQYEAGAAVAPGIYGGLLNAFYAGVKSVPGSAGVLTAGTGPYGDPPGGQRTRPLAFWRDVLCLGGDLQATACPTPATFDIFAHHPINTSGGPRQSAVHPDDASTPDFGKAVDVLRAAERAGTVGTGGRHPAWATELWWESKPPEQCDGVPLRKHAAYLAESLYLLWKQGASAVIWLSVRDQQPAGASECGLESLQAGLTFSDGARKPAFSAFRFPFVTKPTGKGRLEAWGIAPASGKLTIQRKQRGRWRKVESLQVDDNVFGTKLRLRGAQRLRAVLAGERSLVWRQR